MVFTGINDSGSALPSLALVIKEKLKNLSLAYLSTNVIATALMLYFNLLPTAPVISFFVIVIVFWYFYQQVVSVYEKRSKAK